VPQEDPKQQSTEEEGVPAGPASTPIDHPYFLPVLLGAMAIWFGYDGFIDPEMQKEYPTFNRVGFAVLLPLTIWFGYKGWKEVQASKQNPSDPTNRR
jgi:hypothetical protein